MELNEYKDLSGNGGVTGYKLLSNGIILEFKHKELYLYDDSVPGRHHIKQLKMLAEKGKGLTTYINQHIRSNYKQKLN